MSFASFDDRGLISVCPACAQKNRIPYEHLGEVGHCGSCKGEIPPPSVPLEMDSAARLTRIIAASPIPVVVDYWAPWCGPCRAVAPELEKVAARGSGQYLVVKVNTEALPQVGERFQIRGIPTLAVFNNGTEAARSSGARPAAAIEQFIRESIG